MPDAIILYESETLKVSVLSYGDVQTNSTLLSFTGIGHSMGGINVQKIEFVKVGKAYKDIVFIVDKTRSWGNRVEFGTLLDVLKPYCDGRNVDTIGNSMGGFLAFLMASMTKVRVALAFVGQFSVKRDVVPFETRWVQYTKTIDHWSFDSLEGCFNSTTNYVAIVGDNALDLSHMARVPDQSNINIFRIPGFGHNVAAGLKEMGVLDRMVMQSLASQIDTGWVKAEVIDKM